VLEDRRRCQRVRNLVGRRFGALVVEADTGKQNRLSEPVWMACCDCGRPAEVTGYNLRAGFAKHCGCGRSGPARKREQRECVGDLTAARWKKILFGAERRGLTMPLTQSEAWSLFQQQGSRCALTGESVTINDVALDYHPHRPRWVHRDVAKLLALVREDRLREICRALAARSKVSPEAAPGAGQVLPSSQQAVGC
jgi:hypothetical protein